MQCAMQCSGVRIKSGQLLAHVCVTHTYVCLVHTCVACIRVCVLCVSRVDHSCCSVCCRAAVCDTVLQCAYLEWTTLVAARVAVCDAVLQCAYQEWTSVRAAFLLLVLCACVLSASLTCMHVCASCVCGNILYKCVCAWYLYLVHCILCIVSCAGTCILCMHVNASRVRVCRCTPRQSVVVCTHIQTHRRVMRVSVWNTSCVEGVTVCCHTLHTVCF